MTDDVRRAYAEGSVRFFELDLHVARGALVPRAETEILARAAIARLSGAPLVLDMCCGAGNLACAIARNVPAARVWAADLTEGAVLVARDNVARLGLQDRVTVLRGDLFAALDGQDLAGALDLIVCNPPYISTRQLSASRSELLENEPREAFDGGPYGLTIHQRVIREAAPFLKPGGWLLFEVGAGQDRQVDLLFQRAALYGPREQHTDQLGNVRVVGARRS